MYSKKPMFIASMLLAVLAVFSIPQTVGAQQLWQATVGAQSKDMAKQVMAFLPNEIWIHAGDTVNWTSATGEIHTVSFLIAGQKYENFMIGCPGYSTSGVSFNGSTCVSARPLVTGQHFAVKFPKAGNYKLVCLVHPHMTGVIHVLSPSAKLPHNQDFYYEQAEDQTRRILADADHNMEHHDHEDMDRMLSESVIPGDNSVVAGTGEMANTAAGFQSLSVVRFLKGTIEVRVGDTVEWSNLDPSLPHTVTFGTEPGNPGPPSLNVTMDADGARHATLNSVGDSTHSGFLVAAPMDQQHVPQSPPGVTVFRVTFTHPGTYNYICALHDNLGMVGKVIVKP
jgi:plastocyanin